MISSVAGFTGHKLHFHLLLIRDTVCCEFFGPLWMCLFTPTSRASIRKLGQSGNMLSWICIRPVLCSDWGLLGFAHLPNYQSCSLSSHQTHTETYTHIRSLPLTQPSFSCSFLSRFLPASLSLSFSFIASVWCDEGQECQALIWSLSSSVIHWTLSCSVCLSVSFSVCW